MSAVQGTSDVAVPKNLRTRSNSLWLLWALPAGFTTWLMFPHLAYRTRRARYLFWSPFYLAGMVGLFILDANPQPPPAAKNTGYALWLGVWVGGLLHGLVIRRRVNRRTNEVIAQRASVDWDKGLAPGHHVDMAAATVVPFIDVKRPRNGVLVVGGFAGVVILYALGSALAHTTNQDRGVILSVMALVLVMWVGLGIPLYFRAQKNQRADLLASAPDGTIYACRARLLGNSGSSLSGVPGTIAFGRGGLIFQSHGHNTEKHLALSWPDISRANLRPSSGLPLVGAVFVAHLPSGSQFTWLMSQYRPLAAALNELRLSS